MSSFQQCHTIAQSMTQSGSVPEVLKTVIIKRKTVHKGCLLLWPVDNSFVELQCKFSRSKIGQTKIESCELEGLMEDWSLHLVFTESGKPCSLFSKCEMWLSTAGGAIKMNQLDAALSLMVPSAPSVQLITISESGREDYSSTASIFDMSKIELLAAPPVFTDADETSPDYEVERIVGKRLYRSGVVSYLVRWTGYTAKHDEWMELKRLESCAELVEEFESRWPPEFINKSNSPWPKLFPPPIREQDGFNLTFKYNYRLSAEEFVEKPVDHESC